MPMSFRNSVQVYYKQEQLLRGPTGGLRLADSYAILNGHGVELSPSYSIAFAPGRRRPARRDFGWGREGREDPDGSITRDMIDHNMKTIAITIDDDILQRIDATRRAGDSTVNRSRFIREAIKDHLDRIERADEEEHERKIFKRNKSKLHRQALALIKEQAKS